MGISGALAHPHRDWIPSLCLKISRPYGGWGWGGISAENAENNQTNKTQEQNGGFLPLFAFK